MARTQYFRRAAPEIREVRVPQFSSKQARHPQGVTRLFWWEQEGSTRGVPPRYLPIPAQLRKRMAASDGGNCRNDSASRCHSERFELRSSINKAPPRKAEGALLVGTRGLDAPQAALPLNSHPDFRGKDGLFGWWELCIGGASPPIREVRVPQFSSKQARHPQGVTRLFWWEQEGSTRGVPPRYLPIPAQLRKRMAASDGGNCRNDSASRCHSERFELRSSINKAPPRKAEGALLVGTRGLEPLTLCL